MLLHTSISTSSSHSSLSLLLVIYVTPHIHRNILISFVSILASCHLCNSTHPSQHPRLIRLYPCFLSFMLLHTSISTSSSHSSLSLLLVIYVTQHIHLNILISFVYPYLLSFYWSLLRISLLVCLLFYCVICSPSISLSHNNPLHFFPFLHAVLTLCLNPVSMPPFSSTTYPRYLMYVTCSSSSPVVFTIGLSISPFGSNKVHEPGYWPTNPHCSFF